MWKEHMMLCFGPLKKYRADTFICVQMAVYEGTSTLRQENERLRLSIASGRESQARAEEEAAALRLVHRYAYYK